MKLSSRRKVQPPFLRGSRFLSSLLHSSPAKIPPFFCSIRDESVSNWKYSLLRVNTPTIFIFSKHPLLSFSWNILTNFRNVSKRNKISRSKWDNIVSMRRVLEAGPLFHFPFFGRRPITWAERERERKSCFFFFVPFPLLDASSNDRQ